MEETVRDRITILIKDGNSSINSISNGDKAFQRRLNRQINEGASVTFETISSILKVFPNISAEWLIRGEGTMLRQISTTNSDTASHYIQNPHESIPLIPISAMPGAFSNNLQIMEYEYERYIVPAFRGADFLISVKGSSMSPKYNSGDIVACKRLSMSDLFFQWNKVYVLDTDQGPLIKRIKSGSDKEHITIVSDNEQYEPFELSLNHIYHVALVIGVIRLEQ